MSEAARPPLVEHSPVLQRLSWLADRLVVAVAVALPWSVSASSIFIVLWLLAFLPTLNGAKLRASFSLPAGGLPVALCLLALAAMTWSEATQVDQFRSLQIFVRLLIISLLFVQFRHSDHGWWVIGGFIVSCTLLLAVSWLVWFVPQLSWRQQFPGVPVRDYIVQSGEFLICAFALGHLSLGAWRRGEQRRAIALGLLAALFLANIAYVAAARSTFVTLVALALLFVFQRFRWKQALVFVAGAVAMIVLTWMSSPYLRERVLGIVQEIHDYQAKNAETSSGYRLQFWNRSIAIVAEAPIVGHGTGSQRELFRRSVAGKEGLGALVTDNPHNQTLFVAIQLGGLGVVLLYAMWLAHLLLLRGDGLAAWLGTGVAAQNIVMGLFNTSLVDFTFGWMYIFGVGTLGGMMLRDDPSASASRNG